MSTKESLFDERTPQKPIEQELEERFDAIAMRKLHSILMHGEAEIKTERDKSGTITSIEVWQKVPRELLHFFDKKGLDAIQNKNQALWRVIEGH